MSMKERESKIDKCLKVIDSLFKFLGILGTGLVAMTGMYSFIGYALGLVVAKFTLIFLFFSMILVAILIFDRYKIIKEINTKDTHV